MVKFIHAADLHLDSPFKSRSELPPHIVDRLMESTYNATKRMIDYAIKELSLIHISEPTRPAA